MVVQFTLAVVLLSGAGLMMRSFLLAQDEFSFLHGEQVLAARVGLPESRYPKPEDRQQFYEKLVGRLGSLPGAQVVSFVSNIPNGGSAGWRFELEGQAIPKPSAGPPRRVWWHRRIIFRLLGLAVVRGREFEDYDGLPGKEAAIVSQQFVARHYPNQDPIGKRLRLFGPQKRAQGLDDHHRGGARASGRTIPAIPPTTRRYLFRTASTVTRE